MNKILILMALCISIMLGASVHAVTWYSNYQEPLQSRIYTPVKMEGFYVDNMFWVETTDDKLSWHQYWDYGRGYAVNRWFDPDVSEVAEAICTVWRYPERGHCMYDYDEFGRIRSVTPGHRWSSPLLI